MPQERQTSGYGVVVPEDLSSPPIVRRPDKATSGRYGSNVAAVFDAHRYARVIDTAVLLTAGVPTLILPQSTTLRNLLVLRNVSTTDSIYIGFGSPASAFSTVALAYNTPFGTIVLFDDVVPQDDIWAYCATAQTLAYAYSTIGAPST